MNMPTKPNKIIVVAILIIVILAVGFVGGMLFRNFVQKDGNNKPVAQSKPLFSFTGAKDWRQGPNNETSMALFGKQREDETSACFVSIEYKDGSINIDKVLKDQQNSFNGSGNQMVQIDTVSSSLQTKDGTKEYTLYQYKITGSAGGEKLMGGLELGYIQLDNGYVQVDGHCETAEELTTTLPALKAYKLDK